MRPRIYVQLSQAERKVLSAWRWRVVAVYALLAAALVGYSMLAPQQTPMVAHGVSKDEQARAETCVQQTGSLLDAADRQMPRQVVAQDSNRDSNQDSNDGARDCR